MTTPERPKIKKLTLVERPTLKMAEASMHNYRDANLAFLDLIDNAVDNRIPGQPLTITVRVRRNELMVSNVGGYGLDLQGLENLLVWGHSEKTEEAIGQYGVGGKSAMGFLGPSVDIRCSAVDSPNEYHLHDDSWDKKGDAEQIEHSVEDKPAQKPEGYYVLRIENLKPHKPGISVDKAIAQLGDVYKPLLESGAIKITVNNQEVAPLKINYMESNPDFVPQTLAVMTGFGDQILTKVGVLETGDRSLRPGFRVYYRGRKIEDGLFFGLESHLAEVPQLNRLIGEVRLDQVGVTPNKSNFIRDVRFDDASASITQTLIEKGWLDKLRNLEIDTGNAPEEYERLRAERAKRVLELILSQAQLLRKGMFPGDVLIDTRVGGGKKTGTGGEIGTVTTGRERGQSLGASHGNTTKRYGILFEWVPVSFGDPANRYRIVKKDEKEVLEINTDFELYQAMKRRGEVALEHYMVDTALVEVTRVICAGRDIRDIVDFINRASRHIGRFYLQEADRAAKSKRSRGAVPLASKNA